MEINAPTIETIADLKRVEQEDYSAVQHYLDRVTVEEDLFRYQEWLHLNEVTTTLSVGLERYQQRKPGIHPSSASKTKPCLLKLYYECQTEIPARESFDAKAQRIWDLGTYLHVLHQTWFKEMYGDQFEEEVKLQYDPAHITSATDGIFSFTGYRFIIEIKSIKEGGNFGWGTIQVKPMDDHVRQAHFYMWLSNVPFALIFYVNKNTSEYKEHAISFNHSLWHEIWDDVIEPVVAAAYEGGEQVPATPSWSCRWCGYAYVCPEKKEISGGKDVEW